MGTSDAQKINWRSDESHVMTNPRWDVESSRQDRALLLGKPDLPGHIWIRSSGSSQKAGDSAKWIALSKKAFLVSAQAVNGHLSADRSQSWGCVLPSFHVGGLSIFARAELGGARVFTWEGGWAARSVHAWLAKNRISFLSLVPTQLFDFVQEGYRSPESLRAVILGGAALEKSLETKARELGWPVLASFGMTELCSQIATGDGHGDGLKILSHVQAKTDPESRLWVKSEALFTGSLQERAGKIHWDTPWLQEGYWQTSDFAKIQNDRLFPLGREQDFVKINGEGVNLSDVRSRFTDWAVAQGFAFSKRSFYVVACEHPRSGFELILACEFGHQKQAFSLAEIWNQGCFPLERLRVVVVQKILCNELGKVLVQRLRSQIESQIETGLS